MMKILKFNGIRFDNYVNDNTLKPWSQICLNCAYKYGDKISLDMLCECDSGICGVLGCNNKASCYIDFPAADICFANLYANDIDDDNEDMDDYDNG